MRSVFSDFLNDYIGLGADYKNPILPTDYEFNVGLGDKLFGLFNLKV